MIFTKLKPMIDNLLYTISKENHTKEKIKEILSSHPEIKFVSFVGIDLSGNDTDEKIPVNLFLDDLDSFLHGVAVQTDGSSVVLPGIATLNTIYDFLLFPISLFSVKIFP